MKALSVVGIFLCGFGVLAESDQPQTLSNKAFVQHLMATIETAHARNPEVEYLGMGAAMLLDSHRESKITCGRGNLDPKPGECGDAYPIYPEAKKLSEVIAQEQANKVKADSVRAPYIAWKDLNGINVVFNSPAIGEYEISTLSEVDEGGVWSGIRIYYVDVIIGEGEWVKGPRTQSAGFTWLILGAGTEFDYRLQSLNPLGIFKELQYLTDAYAEWHGIPQEPGKLSAEQKESLQYWETISAGEK